MSTFDSASLVMIPSGYKNQKVYSVKPTDGTGDLTFSRASGATRVASNGLIEKVRTNVLTYSQTFSDASWQAGLATKTLGQTDPNGGNTAVLISNTLEANGSIAKAVTLTANVPNTISIYIKAASSGSVSLRIDDSTTGPEFLINYNTNWQRFSVTRTVNQANCTFIIGGYFSFTIGENIQLAFAQAETGDIATDYIATTTAAVSVGPVSGLPRLDYTNSTCPRLLLEPQRTNLVTYSEQFNNAYWGKEEISVTANNSTAPDNTISADKIIPNTTASAHHLTEAVTGAAHSFSVFAKAGGYSTLNILYTVHNAYATFNLSAGTVTETNGTATAKIENYGNGWYRCTVTTSSTTHTEVRIYAINGTTFADRNTAGNGTNGIQLWGAQLEVGAYATSYIPTLGASVTRVADALSKTGITSLIGQTEGTLFLDFEKTNNDNAGLGGYLRIDINDGTIDNRILFGFDLNNINATVVAAGAVTVSMQTTGVQTQKRIKAAFAYKANNFALYVNGVQISLDSDGSVPTSMANFQWGVNQATGIQTSGVINQQLLFKTRLTNAQLAELTA
jgi:hypothetical protein